MHDGRARRGAVARRGVLKALALAPIAVAGCAAARTGRSGSGEGNPSSDPEVAGGAIPSGEALAAIRAVPVPPEAEPAFVFRAAAARPGDAR